MASVSNTEPQPPALDLVAIGKTTRKTLERLASFSRMQSSSTANPLLTTILDKINTLIRLIDSSMLVAQYGYQLSTEALIYCDTDTADWDADVSVERLREISGGALQLSQKVTEGFRDIKQDVYKIAASTKDDMFIVLVPPDPTHPGTLKIQLKEVGADLVANLSLLSDYSRSMTSLTEWCQYVANDLASETPSLLPPSQSDADYSPAVINADTDTRTAPQRLTALWSEMKNGFQEYYNVINVAHLRFPELLGSSSAAWRSVALARSHAPSPAPASQLGHYTTGSSTGWPPSSQRSPAQRKPGLGTVLSVLQRGKSLFERRKEPPRVTVVQPQDMGKERELSDSVRVIPPSVATSPSSDASSPSRYSEPSEPAPHSPARDMPEPRAQSKLLPFSCCCSINIFQDAVALLGNHGCMTK